MRRLDSRVPYSSASAGARHSRSPRRSSYSLTSHLDPGDAGEAGAQPIRRARLNPRS